MLRSYNAFFQLSHIQRESHPISPFSKTNFFGGQRCAFVINAYHHLWILLIRFATQPGLFKKATLTLIPECYPEIKDNLRVQELPRQCLIQPAS